MTAPSNPPRRGRIAIAFAFVVLAATLFTHRARPALSRPPITGIAAVVLETHDMPAEKAFFTHTLGWAAAVSSEYPGGMTFYGDPRQVVEMIPATGPTELAFNHIAWATPDAEGMRRYLASSRVTVPAAITVTANGDKSFLVHDPEGNLVEFLQRAPDGSAHAARPAASLSSRIIHAGFIVRSAAAEDRFYRDVLGFHLYWQGGMQPDTLDWVSMQTPNGTDWVEYMLNAGDHPSARTIGVDDHFSLGVTNMDTIAAALAKRSFPPGADQQHQKQAGKDGKYQLNLYDPDGTRVEFMEFRPFTAPCCHAFDGRQPGPNQQ